MQFAKLTILFCLRNLSLSLGQRAVFERDLQTRRPGLQKTTRKKRARRRRRREEEKKKKKQRRETKRNHLFVFSSDRLVQFPLQSLESGHTITCLILRHATKTRPKTPSWT